MNQSPYDVFDYSDFEYDPLDPFGDFREVFGKNWREFFADATDAGPFATDADTDDDASSDQDFDAGAPADDEYYRSSSNCLHDDLDPIVDSWSTSESDALNWDDAALSINPASSLMMATGASTGCDIDGNLFGFDSQATSNVCHGTSHDMFGAAGFSWE